jgi:hypothetical protein
MMHILGILAFLLALLVAGEVIRSTLVANSEKIIAALVGEAPAPAIGQIYSNLSVVPFPDAAQRRVVSPPVALPLAA